MTFEEKLEEVNEYGGMTRRGFYFGAEWARQETLKEVMKIVKKEIKFYNWGDHSDGNGTPQLDKLLKDLKKLEAKREG